MEYLTLKNSNLTVSRICVGGCRMGGYKWGNVREEDLLDAVHAALDLGINFFDTADTYGLGQSERTLAKGLGSRRKDVVIQSKFGVRPGDGNTVIDNTPAYIRNALEQSLRRLNTDYIDIYVVHYWDQKTPPEEIIAELERHRQAGKIRYFGLSNAQSDVLALCQPFKGRFVTSQNEFSLCCRKWEAEIRQAMDQMDVTALTWGSLGQGILSGKYNENTVFGENDRRSREAYINFHGEKLRHKLRIVEVLREAAASHGKSCSAAAIRFILDYFPEGISIVGIKTPGQIQDIATSQGWRLSPHEMTLLNRISLVGGPHPKETPWQMEF